MLAEACKVAANKITVTSFIHNSSWVCFSPATKNAIVSEENHTFACRFPIGIGLVNKVGFKNLYLLNNLTGSAANTSRF